MTAKCRSPGLPRLGLRRILDAISVATPFRVGRNRRARGQCVRPAVPGGARHVGPLPPPWRYDDHYGFSSLSCIE